LQQVTSGYVQNDNNELSRVGHSKLDAFAEWLEDIPTDEPLVVFCRFIEDIEQLTYECRKAGRTAGMLCGGTNDLQAFKDGTLDTLVCQIQAGSEGIDLTRACICAFFSIGFSLGQYEQALARCDRPGQTRSVTMVRFMAHGTVDERCYQALADKKDAVQAILDARP